MSFVSRDPQPLKSQQEIALEVYQVAIARGLDELAAVIALMTISVESGYWCPWNAADPDSQNYPHDSQSNDGMSVGYFQQQNSAPGANDWWGSMESRMTLAQAADQFLARLSDDYTKSANSPSLAGQYAQQVQGSAFPDRYAQKWTEAWSLLNRALAENPPAPVQPPSPAPQPAPEPVQPQPEAPVTRPDFNEYPRWCTNFEGRNGTKVDLFLLHTEEGNDNADGLASFLISTEGGPNPVSYHYTVSEDPNDHGVTVCDVVDTDNASWSVMSSNQRSINLCFAGSSVNWSRDQWMANDKALDAAAYICARDCLKYGIQVKMLVELDANGNPKYIADPPGIADHRYCTEWLKDGNSHDDVGDNFPWDYFASRVEFWRAALAPAPAPTPAPAPAPSPAPAPVPPAPAPAPAPAPTPAPFTYPSTDDMVKQVWEQLFGPQGGGWPDLFGERSDGTRGLTVVEAIASLKGKTV